MNIDDAGQARSIDRWLDEHAQDLTAIRRSIHAHPELSGQEHVTTELIAERLRLAGLEPRILASGTGLLCDLDPDAANGTRGRLAFRADLDALAMDDEKGVEYRSRIAGVAHACGHDVHTTIMLGTALYFARHRDALGGPLRFIFQPAEEIVPGGALAAIAGGAIADVDAILGIHCDPKLASGSIAIRDGPISSAADMITITLMGPGGHTARPELTVDLIALAARVILELPARVAAKVDEGPSVRLTFGMVRAGDAANVIPTHCTLRASVRTPSSPIWEQLPGAVERALGDLLEGTGARYELEYTNGVPPVVNDPDMAAIFRAAGTTELGPRAVLEAPQSWGGDDFAWYLRQIPGAFVRLGVGDPAPGALVLDLHSGVFDADESSIPLGVRLMVAASARYFEQRGIARI